MNYTEFKNSVLQMPVVFSRDILLHKKDKQAVRNQLRRWCMKGLLIKLKRGIFILNPNDRKLNPSRAYVANQLYAPSYVSLEYALNYYGFIPERVRDVTSVTSKKTLRIDNKLGRFVYLHVKPEAFRGFKLLKDENGLGFFIAEPEKALVDFIYLNLKKFNEPYEEVFEVSYRLQNLDALKLEKLMNFAALFNSDKLTRVSRSLCDFIKKERKR